ncbi:hypothetical protein C8R43DRAFT_943969 [Mycena crocata]|nr:hypothetical protein C8R43DRAFT_943969 [Mycena crocata]
MIREHPGALLLIFRTLCTSHKQIQPSRASRATGTRSTRSKGKVLNSFSDSLGPLKVKEPQSLLQTRQNFKDLVLVHLKIQKSDVSTPPTGKKYYIKDKIGVFSPSMMGLKVRLGAKNVAAVAALYPLAALFLAAVAAKLAVVAEKLAAVGGMGGGKGSSSRNIAAAVMAAVAALFP